MNRSVGIPNYNMIRMRGPQTIYIYIYIYMYTMNAVSVSLPFLLKRFFHVFVISSPCLYRFIVVSLHHLFSTSIASLPFPRFFTISLPFLYRSHVSSPFPYHLAVTISLPFKLPCPFHFQPQKEIVQKRPPCFL